MWKSILFFASAGGRRSARGVKDSLVYLVHCFGLDFGVGRCGLCLSLRANVAGGVCSR